MSFLTEQERAEWLAAVRPDAALLDFASFLDENARRATASSRDSPPWRSYA